MRGTWSLGVSSGALARMSYRSVKIQEGPSSAVMHWW